MFEQKYRQVLELSETGVGLCSRITSSYLENQDQIQELAVGLLAQKVNNHLEAAGIVLADFHLESGKVLLRVAFETIGLLGLCLDDLDTLEEWMFLTSLRREQFPNSRRYGSFVSRLQTRGRDFYDGLLRDSDNPTPVSDLIKDYNSQVHASWTGLLSSAGFEPFQGAFPTEAEQALEESKGDIRLAVKRFRQLRQRSRESLLLLERWSGKVPDWIEGRVDVGDPVDVWDELAMTSIELLSATHHLFDILDDRFGRPTQEANASEFDLWHEESLSQMAGDQD